MVLLWRIHKRRAQHQHNSSQGKAGNTKRRRAQTIQKRCTKIFSLLYHDQTKLFQPFYSNIFPWSKKKGHFSAKYKIFFSVLFARCTKERFFALLRMTLDGVVIVNASTSVILSEREGVRMAHYLKVG